MTWKPSLGAWLEDNGVRFRVWAPAATSLDAVVEGPDGGRAYPLAKDRDGYFTAHIPQARAGSLYKYRVDGGPSYPDPASRFQPQGVHGPSQVVDPARFDWSARGWSGIRLADLVLYELHIGTFSPEGTFAGAMKKLPLLAELGVTAIELMPAGDFPGGRNWGYDGVDLFAPARCYGEPDDLRRLVDESHRLGLATFLDAVYNHLGPEGAYLRAFSPFYFSGKHASPWGDGVNLDDEHCGHARGFFIENALHWVHEYRFDGLRLDATHAMVDDGPEHFIKELARRVRASLPKERPVLIFAEDDRNDNRIALPEDRGGYALDGVWADDFHHQMRSLLAGDGEGYYRDFSGTTEDLALTLQQGWFYTGQRSAFRNAPRGSSPSGIPVNRFVHCIQNHDQVGNRAQGERLNAQIGLSAYRAASALLLTSPATPLIFMGQEWAASTPFLYFTDHPPELGKLVTEGRRNEFRHFKEFQDPERRHLIPDPQEPDTFLSSKLKWEEKDREPHKGVLRLYRVLLEMRKLDAALRWEPNSKFATSAFNEDIIVLRRESPGTPVLLIVTCLKGQGAVDLEDRPIGRPPGGQSWRKVLTTEDEVFGGRPPAPSLSEKDGKTAVQFPRPAAVLLRSYPKE